MTVLRWSCRAQANRCAFEKRGAVLLSGAQRACVLLAIALCAWTSFARGQSPPSAPPPVAPPPVAPPPVAPPPPPLWTYPAPYDAAEVRSSARAHKRRLRDQEQIEQAQHRAQHRLFTYLGFAPVMVTREYPPAEEAGRFRQRAVTLGAAYRHHFLDRIGLHAGANFGVGRAHIGLAAMPGSECCTPSSTQVSPALSLELELAPVLGPLGRAFYFAPGLLLRTIFPLERSETLTAGSAGEDVTRTVTFPSAIATLGCRFGMGLMLGAHHEYDLGFGLDIGLAYAEPRRYFGLFLRFGVAFGDLAAD